MAWRREGTSSHREAPGGPTLKRPPTVVRMMHPLPYSDRAVAFLLERLEEVRVLTVTLLQEPRREFCYRRRFCHHLLHVHHQTFPKFQARSCIGSCRQPPFARNNLVPVHRCFSSVLPRLGRGVQNQFSRETFEVSLPHVLVPKEVSSPSLT